MTRREQIIADQCSKCRWFDAEAKSRAGRPGVCVFEIEANIPNPSQAIVKDCFAFEESED